MKKILASVLLGLLSISISPIYASEHPGQKLLDDGCQQCHNNGMFSRPKSILQSYPELQARVEFCDSAANTHWTEQQFRQVIEYLNDTYYKFPK